MKATASSGFSCTRPSFAETSRGFSSNFNSFSTKLPLKELLSRSSFHPIVEVGTKAYPECPRHEVQMCILVQRLINGDLSVLRVLLERLVRQHY